MKYGHSTHQKPAVPPVVGPPRVLLLDPDERAPLDLEGYLSAHGLVVSVSPDYSRPLTRPDGAPFDVVVARLRPHDASASTLMRRAQVDGSPAVIFIVSTDDLIERVVALEMGADDVIGPHCDPRELLARIRVACRKRSDRPAGSAPESQSEGAWLLNSRTRAISCPAGVSYQLSRSDFEIIDLLVDQPDNFISEEALTEHIGAGSTGTVRTKISRLRRRIPDRSFPLTTIYGMGYRLSTPVYRSSESRRTIESDVNDGAGSLAR